MRAFIVVCTAFAFYALIWFLVGLAYNRWGWWKKL